MGHDIFLSYARADTARAKQIKELLEARGLSVFFDTEGLDGGDVFPDILDREVKTARAVVGVWSKHALTRPWVKIECDIGRARGVLIPVHIEEIPELERPAAFWNIQFADLSDFDGSTRHQGWQRFIRSLERTLKRSEAHISASSQERPVTSASPTLRHAPSSSRKTGIRPYLFAAIMLVLVAAGAFAFLEFPRTSSVSDPNFSSRGNYEEALNIGTIEGYRNFLEIEANTYNREEIAKSVIDHERAIQRIQGALKVKGLLDKPADGVADTATQQAAQQFEMASGIPALNLQFVDIAMLNQYANEIEGWSILQNTGACQTLEATVYFEFDRSDLHFQARENLDRFLQSLNGLMNECDVEKISIVGHTDRSGSREYNLSISSRLADSVSQYLMSRGIDPSLIETSGRGEEAPAIPTEDGVIELLNRRAEIQVEVAQ